MSKRGFMLFREEGDPLRPHPDTSPDEGMTPQNASEFFLAYSCFDSLQQALLAAQDDFESMQSAVQEGFLEDAGEFPYPQPVEVMDDGAVIVTDHQSGEELCRYTADDMYQGFFGMSTPGDTPSPF